MALETAWKIQLDRRRLIPARVLFQNNIWRIRHMVVKMEGRTTTNNSNVEFVVNRVTICIR